MYKCRKCLCRKCLNTCGCRNCQETDGTVTFCDNYNRYEQLGLFAPTPKPIRQKLPRFFTWDDYSISTKRYKELRELCQQEEYATMMRTAAYAANPDIAEYILLSVRENRSFEGIEYADGLGRIPCGRTDFYGYRRLFYHNFDMELKMVQNSSDNVR